MPVTRPRLVDNFVGILKNGVSAVGTTLVSDNFPALPDDFSTTNAMPLVLADDAAGVFEYVLVVGHATGATSVTVIRGARGTVARQWDAGTIVRVASGARDLTQSMTAATAVALADTHAGMEVVDENGRLLKQTWSQGFQRLARVMPGGIGAGVLGAYSPGAGLELLAQSVLASGVTSANGFFNVTLPGGAFPNAILGVFATPKNAPDGTGQLYVPQFCQAYTDTTSATASQRGPVLQFGLKNYNNAAVGSTSVNFSVLALGC